MLNTQTIDKLLSMKLTGMVKALEEQEELPEVHNLSFNDRFGLLVDAEFSDKESEKLRRRLRNAKLKHSAVGEDIDFNHPRGLDRSLLTQLLTCQWIREGLDVLIDGPTGIGKSFLACALGHKACKLGYTTHYYRVPRLFEDLTLARMEGRYNKFLKSLQRFDLLVLDDFALVPVSEEHSRDLLEVVDDRHGSQSMILASQFKSEDWHKAFENPTLADAVLDRIVHGAYKISLKGKTLRAKGRKTDRNGEQ